MIGVARHDDQTQQGAHDPAEILEAELVEEPPARERSPSGNSGAAGSTDHRATGAGSAGSQESTNFKESDEYQEYQEFLKFKQYQEWKRQQGDSTSAETAKSGTAFADPAQEEFPRVRLKRGSPGAGPSPVPLSQRTWWRWTKRILRMKWVRRALLLLLVFLLIRLLINHYFPDGDNEGGSGGIGQHPVRDTAPVGAVITLYYKAAHKPQEFCSDFTAEAAAVFARNHQAPNCPTAAQQIHGQVTDRFVYAEPRVQQSQLQIMNDQLVARSCNLPIEGGPRLGAFRLRNIPSEGWVVVAHQNEQC